MDFATLVLRWLFMWPASGKRWASVGAQSRLNNRAQALERMGSVVGLYAAHMMHDASRVTRHLALQIPVCVECSASLFKCSMTLQTTYNSVVKGRKMG